MLIKNIDHPFCSEDNKDGTLATDEGFRSHLIEQNHVLLSSTSGLTSKPKLLCHSFTTQLL